MSKFFRFSSLFALLTSLLGGAVTYTPARAAGIRYVKPVATGSENCTSWTNACTLQTAIARSIGDDEIWVGAGTYIPHPSDRMISFILKNRVAIYGGFAGTETARNQRNPALNVTILSGDLKGNDKGFANNDENSYHVVIGSNTNKNAILDGFTITGGNANGASWPDNSGGGIYSSSGFQTLSNLIFISNFADWWGGGMANSLSAPILTNVTFSDNRAYSGDSKNGGGGMFNDNSNPRLINVTFSGNSTARGGGMYNRSNSSPTLINVTFSGNSASHGGGGMHNFAGSPTLINVTFSGNDSNCGGGMLNSFASPTLTNVTFSRNLASFQGGGLCNINDSSPLLTNVTFSWNSAISGGGMYNSNTSSGPTLINTIVADSLNGGDCVNVSTTLNASSSNNLVEDSANACDLVNGTNGNVIGSDPKLGPLANNGGFTLTHALLAGSPAINAGTNTNCPTTDQRGLIRPQGGQCDMGAYEFPILIAINGNAGAGGVTLNYFEGTSRRVTSLADGSYSLSVSDHWSGTVTPSHPCFTFSPPSLSYNNVVANQTAQNYSAGFLASRCAETVVKMGQIPQGTHVIPKNAARSYSYPNINLGPVVVKGTGRNNLLFVASEQVQSPKIGTITHFSEMIGLPANLKNITYAFPAYDNANFDSQLRFANLGNVATKVSVTVAGVPMQGSPFGLPAGASTRKSFRGVNNGPVIIQSSGSVPIIASLRVIPRPANGSYSEIIGLPQAQWSTSYHFPWYDNLNLNSQLRVANVGKSTTTVTVTVRGKVVDTFTLGRNKAGRRSILNLNDGPVKVTSSGGVPIVASLRVAFKSGSTWTGFSEMMGLPESQLGDQYVFPGYTHKADLNLKMRLQVANLGASPASVQVFLAGKKVAGFNLGAGKSVVKTFLDLNGGPMRVKADQNIVASLSVRFPTSYSEWIGLPAQQLSKGYLFPWYLNNTTFKTRLRLAVP